MVIEFVVQGIGPVIEPIFVNGDDLVQLDVLPFAVHPLMVAQFIHLTATDRNHIGGTRILVPFHRKMGKPWFWTPMVPGLLTSYYNKSKSCNFLPNTSSLANFKKSS